ncbi:hypothetical protein [Rhodococcus sp. 008]|uniref:hypothetical protein n=1 Tax=Rhodococcus sp. 008 TaxID=1723645 RepID=UPI0008062018|nr:hypothetical protein [Rhodococcus sp. 008]ANQ69428.1 hypothetical protein AOT96_00020 [Rhodococcus sp. 008]
MAKTKTHCKNGHAYTPENTLWKTREGVPITKYCKTCQYAANQRYIGRQVAAYKAEHGIES